MHGSHHTGHRQVHGGAECPSCRKPLQGGARWGYGYCPQPQMMGGMGIRPTYPVAPQMPTTDEEIADAVYQNLTNDPRIPPEANIAVEVQDGVVTLSGSAPDKLVKWAAGGDALCVPNVVDVNNILQIGRRGTSRRQRP